MVSVKAYMSKNLEGGTYSMEEGYNYRLTDFQAVI